EDDRFLTQHVILQATGRVGEVAQSEIGLTGAYKLADAVAVRRVETQADRSVLPAEVANGLEQVGAGEGAYDGEEQVAPVLLRYLFHRAHAVTDGCDDGSREWEECLSCRGEPRAGPATEEERSAEVHLKQVDPAADRWLRDMQAPGGLREGSGIGNREECLDLDNLHTDQLNAWMV